MNLAKIFSDSRLTPAPKDGPAKVYQKFSFSILGFPTSVMEQQKKVFKPSFSNSGSNQSDIENPQKIHFKPLTASKLAQKTSIDPLSNSNETLTSHGVLASG